MPLRPPFRLLPRSLFRSLWSALLAGALLAAPPALAHGPTFQVSPSSVRPAQLVIEVGQTIHFRNASHSGTPLVLRFEQAPEAATPADDDELRSPPMGRAGDWHHTFETAGRYVFVVEGFSARGTIQVVPAAD